MHWSNNLFTGSSATVPAWTRSMVDTAHRQLITLRLNYLTVLEVMTRHILLAFFLDLWPSSAEYGLRHRAVGKYQVFAGCVDKCVNLNILHSHLISLVLLYLATQQLHQYANIASHSKQLLYIYNYNLVTECYCRLVRFVNQRTRCAKTYWA